MSADRPTGPLVEPEDLALRLDDPALRLADVRWFLGEPERGRAEYEAGHLPGAVFVDLDRDLAAPDGPGRHPLPEPAAFAARMAELGFGDDDWIVAYDDAGGAIAGRLWWMLDNLGHPRVSVLDGGLRAWRDLGLPLTADLPSHPPSALHLRTAWANVIDREALADRLGEVVLIDARAGERYRGEVEPVDPAAGHIPTAVSAPAGRSLGPGGRFLPPDILRTRFDELGAGADADRDVVTSCGSGVTACHVVLARRIAGLPDPILYPGSFSDWSRADGPIATGPEPGARPGD
jgi:thiosulfate/3-mercaptopyruvate sulfurtransferase